MSSWVVLDSRTYTESMCSETSLLPSIHHQEKYDGMLIPVSRSTSFSSSIFFRKSKLVLTGSRLSSSFYGILLIESWLVYDSFGETDTFFSVEYM